MQQDVYTVVIIAFCPCPPGTTRSRYRQHMLWWGIPAKHDVLPRVFSEDIQRVFGTLTDRQSLHHLLTDEPQPPAALKSFSSKFRVGPLAISPIHSIHRGLIHRRQGVSGPYQSDLCAELNA